MKKIFTLLIAVLYLTVSSGLAVELHHCMGEIKDISLATSKSNKCSSCGMEKGSNKCCKDELKFVKLQDSHKLLNVNHKLPIPKFNLQHNQYLINNAANFSLSNSNIHSPSYYPAPPLYLLNRVLRI